MVIQWFPGHMTKALRMMEQEIKLVDAIFYVLDARAPFSCVNPKLNQVIGNKPIIYILNKSDMANEAKTKDWLIYFKKMGAGCITLNSTESGTGKKLLNELKKALEFKINKFKAKGIQTILRAMVLGVPNSGKSTLINNLCGKAKTITGNKPGVTKGKQWVRVDGNIEILDTPGTLWPAFENNEIAHHLAYIGSIKEEILDVPSLSLDFIEELNCIDINILKNRYNIEFNEISTPLEILEKICIARGCKLSGNELDYDKASTFLLNDFKQGKLGKISLECISDIEKLSVINRKFKKEEF